uniref:Nuclear receptor domain-containing protein n=2 Tax=Clastoptera arizonana TaxID=38151 RepID=A0A1B6DTC3_9HEMI
MTENIESKDLNEASSSLTKDLTLGQVIMNNGKNDQGGTVVCGVCGAVRYYSFVKQAKKFGVYSCESCRKFISKIIHNKGGSKIKCKENKGKCTIPPYVINPLDSSKFISTRGKNARCHACWLQLCLNAFKMPAGLSDFLMTKLPDYMLDPLFVPATNNFDADAAYLCIQSNRRKHTKESVDKEESSASFEQLNTSYDQEMNSADPNVKQKRKAATKFMANISRITGRVSDEFPEDLVQPRKRKHNYSPESKQKSKSFVQVKKVEHVKSELEYDNEKRSESEVANGSGNLSVQDVINKVGRPKLIIITRNVKQKKSKISKDANRNFSIKEDEHPLWDVIG